MIWRVGGGHGFKLTMQTCKVMVEVGFWGNLGPFWATSIQLQPSREKSRYDNLTGNPRRNFNIISDCPIPEEARLHLPPSPQFGDRLR